MSHGHWEGSHKPGPGSNSYCMLRLVELSPIFGPILPNRELLRELLTTLRRA